MRCWLTAVCHFQHALSDSQFVHLCKCLYDIAAIAHYKADYIAKCYVAAIARIRAHIQVQDGEDPALKVNQQTKHQI